MSRSAAFIVTLMLVHTAVGLGEVAAGPLEPIVLEGVAQTRLSGGVVPGGRIQGDLAKPAGRGRFPAVVALHGCAGMHDTTKVKLADHLTAAGFVVLFVDSFTPRGVAHLCTYSADNIAQRMADAFGALAYLGRQEFVDARRISLVGFSQGGTISLLLAEPRASETFSLPFGLRFRAAVAFYPQCSGAWARPMVPTLILSGGADAWTPAEECARKVAGWGAVGSAIEHVVYPGVHHGFYYPHLQPGRTLFGYWVEHDGHAAADAGARMRAFLDRQND